MIGSMDPSDFLKLRTYTISKACGSAFVNDFYAVLNNKRGMHDLNLRAIKLGHARHTFLFGKILNDHGMIRLEIIDGEERARRWTQGVARGCSFRLHGSIRPEDQGDSIDGGRPPWRPDAAW